MSPHSTWHYLRGLTEQELRDFTRDLLDGVVRLWVLVEILWTIISLILGKLQRFL